MDAASAIEVGQDAVYTMLVISLPLMLVSLGIGIIISLFQAMTQIQEMTLTFVPKIIIVFLALLFFLPFMLAELISFFERVTDRMIGLGS